MKFKEHLERLREARNPQAPGLSRAIKRLRGVYRTSRFATFEGEVNVAASRLGLPASKVMALVLKGV